MRGVAAGWLVGLAFVLRALPAPAACNVIPPALESFRGALAAADRPFARPGDWLRLAIDPTCHGASAGFPAALADQIVTVVFKPPGGGARNVVVMATDCGAVDLAACAARPDVDTATCVTANAQDDPVSLQRIDAAMLRFRFPDSDAQVAAGGDRLTLTGPTAVAVSAAAAPPPCDLASLPCRNRPGLFACLDEIYADNGSCNTQLHSTFSHFTALPPANDYQALCSNPSPPCTGQTDELRFTVDAAGNILLPMDWRGVRVDRDAVPIARLLRASSTVEAFEGRGVPIRITDLASLGSYSPEGIKLPPLFDPQTDPTNPGTATFFGSVDAEETVLRLARHRAAANACAGGSNDALPCTANTECPGGACAAPVCIGGSSAGTACAADADCPGGECGPGLFEFRTRLLDDVGPVLLRVGACIGGASALAACANDGECPGGQCGAFTMTALDPVPLDGLNQSALLNAFVLSEAIAEPPLDLNGDGDAIDPVVKLADRATGAAESIGDSGSDARAVVRVLQPPFSFPAVAVDGDLLAFLEPESWQGAADHNDNRRVFDTLLRAYRLSEGEVTDPLLPLAADAAPLINDRSLAISDGLVFFRSSESAAALQETTRANVDSAGNQATGGTQYSFAPSLSADGRWVVFASHATNLVPNDTNNVFDIFVRDRQTATTRRVSVSGSGAQSNGASLWSPFLSADGRYVAFSSDADNLVSGDSNTATDVFVHDRDADSDGIFDETGPGARATVRISVGSGGTQGNALSRNDLGNISSDGRFVTFYSLATNLVPGDGNGAYDAFVHDRDADGDGVFDETGPGERATVRISVDPDGLDAAGASTVPTIADGGRFVAFESAACDLIPGDCSTTGDTNGATDIFLRDRDVDADGVFDEAGASGTIRISVDAFGVQGGAPSFEPRISADGSTVVFASLAGNLVAGDTNGFRDVFAYDRVSGQMSALTVSPSGQVGNSNSGSPVVSGDGRMVAFDSRAANLTAGITDGIPRTFLHDRLTRLTTLLSVNTLGEPANDWTSPAPAISLDGSVVAFTARTTDLVADDTNGQDDIFVRAAVPGSGDLSGDGTANDTVLRVLDTSSGPPSPLVDLCPADTVAVAAGRAAFLRPEAAGDTPSLAACPSGPLVGGDPDLNADGDAADAVVHFWNGTAVDNLALAATYVALSDTWIAALASEAGQDDSDLNFDSDAADAVLHVHPAGSGVWTNTNLATEGLALTGSLAAVLVSEAAQSDTDLNGDGDSADRVVHTYDAALSAATNVREAAEELVLGGAGLVAFRTLEAAQGGDDLNQDGDEDDAVLQVYDAGAGTLLNSGQAVTPCRLEACDPRVPYRVRDDTVTFLTLETDQGEDLNGDGDYGDLVLQVLNVRQACQNGPGSGTCHTLAAASAGICTDTGAACAGDDACPGGDCFVPPGGCQRNLGVACNPINGNGCLAGLQFCQPILGAPNLGTCYAAEGPCGSDVDCTLGATCNQAARDIQRLMDPLGEQGGGTAVFTSAGRCTEVLGTACSVSSQCEAGAYCEDGVCQRQHGPCAADADCPPTALCRSELVRATADDADLDELPDAIDNCPQVANIVQEDFDEDGVGDACDALVCGNGIEESAETCDDSNGIDGDGCDSNCTVTGCGNGIATTGEACDDGNAIDGDGCDANCTASACGNGIVAAGETCDDGNAVDGDGCDSNCTASGCGNGIAAGGEGCDDGNAIAGDGCESDCQPTPGGGCPPLPLSTCGGAERNLVLLKSDPAGSAHKGLWKWSGGAQALEQTDFGDPVGSGTGYRLCIYDYHAGVPQLAMRTEIDPAGTCEGVPCWRAAGSAGWKYLNKPGNADGVYLVTLKAGATGQPKILVKARGAAVPLPAPAGPTRLLAHDATVVVQFHRRDTGACWSSAFTSATTHTATQFKAKSP